MARRNSSGRQRPQRALPRPSDSASVSGNIIHPGIARNVRVHQPVRETLIRSGVYRPSNRWRATQGGSGQQILQRAQNLARLLPWNTHYNFARS